ncbi:MAG: bifunctional glutamate N-acetyltransferase/amino-acid acetyltransferase ArgJ [Actinobacteria bacterium]|nr:bifunctional glutamate N-acetyltransferase/amino-acid acetyltransferase ArgJ [Actinomycetota bacterium]
MYAEVKASGGGVCAPRGFKAAAAACGLKASGDLDLCILAADARCAAAATFTTNAFHAAPVALTREHIEEDGFLQAVVVNSGNANAWTGERGMLDARDMASLAAGSMGIDNRDVAVASTGVIGRYLDMDKVAGGIAEAAAKMHAEGGSDAAAAIMTTDTVPKEIALECGGFTVGGMAKGAGMIKPDMATMLAFITTDAEVDHAGFGRALRSAVDRTFNRITIDGCTSTNDMVLAMASGASGVKAEAEELEDALHKACSHLARAIVEDGEGATKFIAVRMHEACSEVEAKHAAVTVAESALVKTAFFGGDPNWGRVVQAVGQAVKDADPGKMRVKICGITVAEAGEVSEVDMEKLAEAMTGKALDLDVFLGRGDASVEVWTCDFSYDYVKINAEYHT